MEPRFGEMKIFKQPYETITLPDKGKMMERLLEAKGGTGGLPEHLYTSLLKIAGREVTADGIVTTLAAAIDEYLATASPNIPDIAKSAEDFIDALTPGAKKDLKVAAVRESAKRRWRELYGESETETEPTPLPEQSSQ